MSKSMVSDTQLDDDVSFNMQVHNDINAAMIMPCMVPQVEQFLDVLNKINLPKIIQQEFQERPKSKKVNVKIDFNYCQLSHPIPMNVNDLAR